MNEFDIIATYLAPLATYAGAHGLRDDAAVLDVPAGQELVITTDTLIADVHFYASDPANLIAKKALRVSLSDLASKGAKPYAFTLNLGLPKDTPEVWIKSFMLALSEDISHYKIHLLGGDTVRSPVIMLTVTAFGLTPKIVRRTSAQGGDFICVSGTIGDAALGLKLKSATPHYRNRYLLPNPRLDLCETIRNHATSAMDISDGLIGDLEKLLIASQKAGEIHIDKIPLHAPLTPQELEIALTGGDDYELLFTCSPESFAQFKNNDITCIGVINEGEGLRVLDAQNKEVFFSQKSYTH